jgi:hypothetical protein
MRKIVVDVSVIVSGFEENEDIGTQISEDIEESINNIVAVYEHDEEEIFVNYDIDEDEDEEEID